MLRNTPALPAEFRLAPQFHKKKAITVLPRPITTTAPQVLGLRSAGGSPDSMASGARATVPTSRIHAVATVAPRRRDSPWLNRIHAVATKIDASTSASPTASIEKRTPDPADRAVLDAELGKALVHLRTVPADGIWRWEFVDTGELDSMLWPLARDAAELLTSPDLDRVRECSGSDCTWLFADKSRNRSRRWCDMAECGNRSKARRFYRRQKAGA